MTYLELVRRLALEVGASGPVQTVQTDIGEVRRLATWVQQAWTELQLLRDTWRWRQKEFEVVLPSGEKVLNLKTLIPDYYKLFDSELYIKAGGTWVPLSFVSYKRWQSFARNDFASTGAPTYYTIRPDDSIEFYPIPSTDIPVRGLYVTAVQTLENDFDVPALPEEYQSLIVYKAMMLYGGYESAPEIYQTGVQGYSRMMALLTNNETPPVELPDPLA